jgi:hypothetical protein
VDGSVGMDDARTVEAVETALKRPLTTEERDKLRAGDGLAITFTFRDCVGVRFINPDFADRHLHAVNEAFHVVCSVMRFVGVRLTGASEEAFAYLLQHVHGKLLEGDDA